MTADLIFFFFAACVFFVTSQAREWKVREEEIEKLQAQRLELLREHLSKREDEQQMMTTFVELCGCLPRAETRLEISHTLILGSHTDKNCRSAGRRGRPRRTRRLSACTARR